jgi:hypothetical protein
MKIDEQRNLCLPIVTETITKKVDGKDVTEEIVKLWAFHTPISRAIFEQHYRVLAATKSVLASKGAHYLWSSAPRIAALTLRDEGMKDAAARGSFGEDGKPKDDETPALIAELKRLTMVLCPGHHGWDMLPVDAAISSGKLDAEDWEEEASAIVFFTCNYAMARKADRETTAMAYASPIGASITSSSATEFAGSLPILTQGSHTPAAPSLIPS